MNQTKTNIPVVLPPALDIEETELAARNEFLAEKDLLETNDLVDSGFGEQSTDDLILDENDAVPGGVTEEQEVKILKSAKRRKSLLFLTIFGAGFGVFVLFISWAFGFGFFAAPSRVSVDRNQKTNGANSSPSVSSDEKLKTALSLVANETENSKDAPVVSDNSTNPNAVSEEDLKLNSDEKTSESSNNQQSGNMIVLRDENPSLNSSGAQNQIPVSQPLSPRTVNSSTANLPTNETSGGISTVQPNTTNNGGANFADKTDGAVVARSVFFGRIAEKKDSVSQNSVTTNASIRQTSVPSSNIIPPFGTLLPVRFLGAVYTLQRGSGSLVRMELSRAVQRQGFSFPAGTVMVGRLRGSEYNRAFITIIGAIDPKSGKLIKFEGDLFGVDGASGVVGIRKSIKSWGARFLNALREAGGQVVNVLAARGGRGGTIILGGTTGLGGEVSEVIRGNSQNDSFVIIKAGTDAYVLVTDLPGEQREGDVNERLSGSENQIPGINLSESEMAEILSTDDANKIRAAFMKMSPQFRSLAIKAMEENK